MKNIVIILFKEYLITDLFDLQLYYMYGCKVYGWINNRLKSSCKNSAQAYLPAVSAAIIKT